MGARVPWWKMAAALGAQKQRRKSRGPWKREKKGGRRFCSVGGGEKESTKGTSPEKKKNFAAETNKLTE